MKINFTLTRQTKRFNVYEVDEGQPEFFPKAIYLNKEEMKDCKKISITIKKGE